jgi:hypothetical protein
MIREDGTSENQFKRRREPSNNETAADFDENEPTGLPPSKEIYRRMSVMRRRWK